MYSFEFAHHLTIQDYYSKWPELYKLKETTTRAVISCLKDGFSRCGNPQIFLTNNGPQFQRYLNHSLRAAKLQGFVIRESLPEILHIFRATPHAATGRREQVTCYDVANDQNGSYNIASYLL